MGAERWLRVTVSVPTEAVEAVSYFLVELGSIGIAEGEWKPDTPPPARTLIQGFFPADRDSVALLASLTKHLQRIATENDARAHLAPSVAEFGARSREHGLKAALQWRDTKFGDQRALVDRPELRDEQGFFRDA